eukprot:TRINITY_DN11614_c0_g1_i1.p2 TRINITY_DN11614_c0_g1~~TRINITY_DN11614_c0_g1_i1.p2  ORF type:complete len:166 (+),score=29.05 TRINITY_DN11614_c0_g1_i1:1-498(+)
MFWLNALTFLLPGLLPFLGRRDVAEHHWATSAFLVAPAIGGWLAPVTDTWSTRWLTGRQQVRYLVVLTFVLTALAPLLVIPTLSAGTGLLPAVLVDTWSVPLLAVFCFASGFAQHALYLSCARALRPAVMARAQYCLLVAGKVGVFAGVLAADFLLFADLLVPDQ